jgi:Sec7-like guanine-nucleotide exchange factor
MMLQLIQMYFLTDCAIATFSHELLHMHDVFYYMMNEYTLLGLILLFNLVRFLGAIKQYLCLSLLKNCASSHMIVFQLSCSIFISLVSRFRPGLKAEIGVFFPMIILRVLENIAQPNFQAKMIVLRFLEKLCADSQILVDIFINYDCDVHSSNIFERYCITHCSLL